MATKKKIQFEKALEELESLVDAMEEGDQSLEEALKTFEKGVRLTRDCQQALSEAEQKVEILLNKNGDEASYDTFTSDDDSID